MSIRNCKKKLNCNGEDYEKKNTRRDLIKCFVEMKIQYVCGIIL